MAEEREAKLVVSAKNKASRVLKGLSRQFAPLARQFKAIGERTGLTSLNTRLRSTHNHLDRTRLATGRLRGALVGLVSVAGLARLGRAFSQGAAGLDDMSKAARRLGLPLDEMRKFSALAQQAGISSEQSVGGLRQAARLYAEIRSGAFRGVKQLDALAPGLSKTLKGAKDTGAAISILFDVLRHMPDEASKIAFAERIFGDAGFAEIVANGPAAFRQEMERIGKLIGPISDQQGRAVEEMSDRWDDMMLAIAGTRDALLVELAPSLTASFGKVADFLGDTEKRKSLVAEMAGLFRSIGTSLTGIDWEGMRRAGVAWAGVAENVFPKKTDGAEPQTRSDTGAIIGGISGAAMGRRLGLGGMILGGIGGAILGKSVNPWDPLGLYGARGPTLNPRATNDELKESIVQFGELMKVRQVQQQNTAALRHLTETIRSMGKFLFGSRPENGGAGSLRTEGFTGEARAAGGPVAAGKTYLVGERGPELFTPDRSGSIVPNSALGSSFVSVTRPIMEGLRPMVAAIGRLTDVVSRLAAGLGSGGLGGVVEGGFGGRAGIGALRDAIGQSPITPHPGRPPAPAHPDVTQGLRRPPPPPPVHPDVLHGLRQAVLPEQQRSGLGRISDTISASGPYQKLLDVIGSVEAPRGYDQIFGGAEGVLGRHNLTGMTLDQVFALQRRMQRVSPSSAVGRYQFIRSTLSGLAQETGLTGKEMFTPELQDMLAGRLLERRGLGSFLSGRLSTAGFANNLAKEWASLPIVSGMRRGLSYYAGDGLNKALMAPGQILSTLSELGSGNLLREARAAGLSGGMVDGAASLEVRFKNAPAGMGVRASKSGPLFKEINLDTGHAMRPADMP